MFHEYFRFDDPTRCNCFDVLFDNHFPLTRVSERMRKRLRSVRGVAHNGNTPTASRINRLHYEREIDLSHRHLQRVGISGPYNGASRNGEAVLAKKGAKKPFVAEHGNRLIGVGWQPQTLRHPGGYGSGCIRGVGHHAVHMLFTSYCEHGFGIQRAHLIKGVGEFAPRAIGVIVAKHRAIS